MYTQCPKCRTVFRVTLEQLQTREGVVRCGQCTHVFQADHHLYTEIPEETPKQSEKSGSGAAVKKPRGDKLKAGSGVGRPARRSPRHGKTGRSEPAEVIEVTAAPAPWSPAAEDAPSPSADKAAEKRSVKGHGKIPQGSATAPLLVRQALRRLLSALWIVGSALLVILLAGQTAYFYRDALADYPQFRPFIVELCQQFGCAIRLSSDVGSIELVRPTGIAPHPRTGNALRLRATMVNRSQSSQPYPLMEVTLSDSAGRTLARRTFTPREYLERPTMETEMSPNLAVSILLDVTNPNGKAVGYQIDFVAPPPR